MDLPIESSKGGDVGIVIPNDIYEIIIFADQLGAGTNPSSATLEEPLTARPADFL
jgi:hypothetical protein